MKDITIEGNYWITVCVLFWTAIIVTVSAPWIIPYILGM